MFIKKVAKYITFYQDSIKSPLGYYRFTHGDEYIGLEFIQKVFTVKKYGGKGKALAAAKAYKAERLGNYERTSQRDPFYLPNKKGIVNSNGHTSIFSIKGISISYEARSKNLKGKEPLDLWNGYKDERCQFLIYAPFIRVQKNPPHGSGKKVKFGTFPFKNSVEFDKSYDEACVWLIKQNNFDVTHLPLMFAAIPIWTTVMQHVLARERYQIKSL